MSEGVGRRQKANVNYFEGDQEEEEEEEEEELDEGFEEKKKKKKKKEKKEKKEKKKKGKRDKKSDDSSEKKKKKKKKSKVDLDDEDEGDEDFSMEDAAFEEDGQAGSQSRGRKKRVNYKELDENMEDIEEDEEESRRKKKKKKKKSSSNKRKRGEEDEEDEGEEGLEEGGEDYLFQRSRPQRQRKKPKEVSDKVNFEEELEDDIFEDNVPPPQEEEAPTAYGYVTLKIEKLLAHQRKTKGEWLAFCKGMNTSKVKQGRRVELIAFEDAVEEQEELQRLKEEGVENIEKMLRKRLRKRRKVSKKKLRKEETRYLVKWLKESYFHVSWETSKALKAYLTDNRAVDRHIRKLEQSSSMMDEEELADLQKVDRVVDYNTFTEEVVEETPAVQTNPETQPSQSDAGATGASTAQGNGGVAHPPESNEQTAKSEAAVESKEDDDDENDDDDMDDDEEDEKNKSDKATGETREVTRWEYLVKWKSQGFEDATWELLDDLKDVPGFQEKLEQFQTRESTEYREARGSLGTKDATYDSKREFKNHRKLRSYQVEAVEWLTFNFSLGRGSILADEMGLGKTCQTVTYIHRLRHAQGVAGPFLIVAPLATLPHWQREFEAWTNFNCITYHGSADGRALIRAKEFFWEDGKLKGPKGMPKFDALVTNYETILSDTAELKKFRWSLLVVDEAHRLKNRDSRLTVCLRETFRFDATMLLTGTPIQNSLPELWTLLNFIAPNEFNSLEEFKSKYDDMKTANEMDQFHQRLRPFMLRRIKSEVEPLPDREDVLIEVELTFLQKRFYRAIYEKNTEYLLAGVQKGARVSLNNVAMELRKCCCHPYLIDGVESKVLTDSPFPPNATPEEKREHIFGKLVESSGKLILLDKLLPKLKNEGHRVLIFSQMTRMLDILEDYLLFRNYAYERIDGSVRGVDRQFAIDRFSSQNSQSFAFLLSTRGCGQGINLTAADTVIMYDGDWNPQNDVQALARCHRIGQTKKVMVYRLITRKTYEQTMFQRASMKLGLDKAVMTGLTTDATGAAGSSVDKRSKKEQDKETERLLKYGAYALTEDNDDTDTKQFLNADIDEILTSRSKQIISASEDNRLSKATFVAADNDTNLDVDDPEFWTKVVGLKENKKQEEDFLPLRRRAKDKVVSYKDGFNMYNEGENELAPDEDSEDEQVVEGQPKDEDGNGRKLWMRKHYMILQIVIACYGYGRWDEAYRMVQERFPGRYTKEDVEKAIRGFAIFCALKQSRKKSESGESSESSEEEDVDNDSEQDDEQENNSVSAPAYSSTGKISDFTLVNLTSKQAADRIEAVLRNHRDGDVFRERIIPDLRAGKEFQIPDVLVTRFRTRVDDEQDDKELLDFDSDDSDLEGEAREQKRREKRGHAFREEISVRVKKFAAKNIRKLDTHLCIQKVVEKHTDPKTGKLNAEGFPKIPGSMPMKWWTPTDDLVLLVGLYKYGWDPRKSGNTFTLIREDKSLAFTVSPPERDENRKREAALKKEAELALKKEAELALKKEATSDQAPVKMEVDDDKQQANPTPSADTNAADVKSEVNKPEVKSEVKPEETKAVNAQASSEEEKKEDESVKMEVDSETKATKEEETDDADWTNNPKLGHRAKRVVDWFRSQERKERRKEDQKQRAMERAEKKQRDKESKKKKRVRPSVVEEWSKSEKRALYRALLRYGMPIRTLPAKNPDYFTTHEFILQRAGLGKKNEDLLDMFMKQFIQDVMQLRLKPDFEVPARTADVVTSNTSAKKLMERLNMMRDLRNRVLCMEESAIRKVISRHTKSMSSKKKTQMPKWWTVDHDMGLLKGCARHGVGSAAASEDVRADPTLPFHEICAAMEDDEKKKKGEDDDDDDDAVGSDNDDVDNSNNTPVKSKPSSKSDDEEDDVDETAGGNGDGEEDKAESSAPSGDQDKKERFPAVGNRLRALVDILVRFQQQNGLTIDVLLASRRENEKCLANLGAGDAVYQSAQKRPSDTQLPVSASKKACTTGGIKEFFASKSVASSD